MRRLATFESGWRHIQMSPGGSNTLQMLPSQKCRRLRISPPQMAPQQMSLHLSQPQSVAASKFITSKVATGGDSLSWHSEGGHFEVVTIIEGCFLSRHYSEVVSIVAIVTMSSPSTIAKFHHIGTVLFAKNCSRASCRFDD